jgi:hypothetical protein
MEKCCRFVPSRVEGLPDVREVVVFADRLELATHSKQSRIWLAQIAHWPQPRWLWRWLFRARIRPRWLPVADRDWFHAPSDRFFKFYTDPPLQIFMPVDEHLENGKSHFMRIQEVLMSGGFHTFDLG